VTEGIASRESGRATEALENGWEANENKGEVNMAKLWGLGRAWVAELQ
jgi:hypothetical protein